MDDELVPQLDEIAQSLRRSKSWIINDALRLYIEREQRRQQMLRETEEALADLEANRLLSGEEVMNWLETWGTDHEIEAPKL
jgi:predicted transcriptional regulator